MNWTAQQEKWAGQWRGTNRLHLSWMTPSDYISASELSVMPIAMGTFLAVTSTWEHDGEKQEGFLLLGYDTAQAVATAAWGDSWHMSKSVLFCQGTITQEGTLDLRGTYEAPPGPDWGWRIVLSIPSDMELHLVMFNCSPEGDEELAVEATYLRTLS